MTTAEMLKKSVSFREMKFYDDDGSTGRFKAKVATLETIDLDGEVLHRGCIGQQPVRIAAWGHNWNDLPVGKAFIYEDGVDVIAEGEFFLDTFGGQETYKVVKALGELQEWSFGFFSAPGEWVKPAWQGHRDVKQYNKVKVQEITPVMRAASVGSETLHIRSHELARQQKEAEEQRLNLLVDQAEVCKECIEEDERQEFLSEVDKQGPEAHGSSGTCMKCGGDIHVPCLLYTSPSPRDS